MNSVSLTGRLTKDVELRYIGDDTAVSNFTIAVDKFVNGEKKADFINCVVWGRYAETLAEYTQKGDKIGLVGSIQTRTYDKNDGTKAYVTEVRAQHIEFLESKPKEEKQQTKSTKSTKGTKQQTRTRHRKDEDLKEVDDGDMPF